MGLSLLEFGQNYSLKFYFLNLFVRICLDFILMDELLDTINKSLAK